MSNPGFLFAGFALAWAAAFVYVWIVARRSARLQRELEQIEERLDRD